MFAPRPRLPLLLCGLLLAVLSPGCGAPESVPLSPMPNEGASQLGLGDGVTPLTYGPGYKSAPEWNPEGDLLSFVVDGYVADKRAAGGSQRTLTTRDFDARSAEWLSGDRVVILGRAGGEESSVQRRGASGGDTLYISNPTGEDPEVSEVFPDVLTVNSGSPDEPVLVAQRSGESDSSLSVIGADGVPSGFEEPVEGTVTGISLSPDGDRAVLAVTAPGKKSRSGFVLLDMVSGERRTLVTLPEGQKVTGDPQWTTRGIYYIAETPEDGATGSGEEDRAGAEETRASGASTYSLNRVGPENGEPGPAPGVGSEFLPSSVAASPDGNRLAIVGRLRSDSPSNLHVLDTETSELRPFTDNEDMEIKNGSRDIAWSPDGESVTIVARGSFSGAIVRSLPADVLLDEFYNLYRVPVGETEDGS